jgi:hypothetical protein
MRRIPRPRQERVLAPARGLFHESQSAPDVQALCRAINDPHAQERDHQPMFDRHSPQAGRLPRGLIAQYTAHSISETFLMQAPQPRL